MPNKAEAIEEIRKEFWDLDRCHDCTVLIGEVHHDGCDVEECPKCHDQIIICGCEKPWKTFADRIKYGDETRGQFASDRSLINSLESSLSKMADIALSETEVKDKLNEIKDKFDSEYKGYAEMEQGLGYFDQETEGYLEAVAEQAAKRKAFKGE